MKLCSIEVFGDFGRPRLTRCSGSLDATCFTSFCVHVAQYYYIFYENIKQMGICKVELIKCGNKARWLDKIIL